MIQPVPLKDLREALFATEAKMFRLMRIGEDCSAEMDAARAVRSLLPSYAEHRWDVRAWRAKKRRGGHPSPEGPVVA